MHMLKGREENWRCTAFDSFYPQTKQYQESVSTYVDWTVKDTFTESLSS